ncbi:alpha/beta hydrolase [Algibacter luteus]|uniref:Lysophospholipase, alpha-beta hydrolase superfamily n=1 Tax=Algibacter luteus TaxID=1178825 RepID=A0A1M6ABZ6_9FLAO|nr:alpha/beta hydrolase [Algibacter luteus]SHI33951.1 Lysophospholipase, alpha-beta hydrolase superfamily [Algibacter luteus]
MNQTLLKTIGSVLNLISFFSSNLAAKIAIHFFSSPQKGRLKGLNAAFLKSAIRDVLEFEGIKIATYHWEGNNETILLAHGWESNTSRWEDLIHILRESGYNVVAIDAPAHGNSSGKLFNALLYSECIHLVAEKFQPHCVIGHSVGGMATVFFQHKYQISSIKKMILLGAPSNFLGVFKRYSNMMGYNESVINAMNQYVLKKYNHLPEYYSAAKFSEEIAAEGLIIHDKKDKIIPYRDALDFEKHYSNSKLITTKGYGHGLKNETIYNYILEFLNA